MKYPTRIYYTEADKADIERTRFTNDKVTLQCGHRLLRRIRGYGYYELQIFAKSDRLPTSQFDSAHTWHFSGVKTTSLTRILVSLRQSSHREEIEHACLSGAPRRIH
jgi:hypothetical protein